ncbi:hypothetical protein [Saccharothrix lopnurensis]|uniref:Fibronectin attachment protein n=1 Tax=Saccharothrix lopnurensis TaxID=1670621 RepID=A0ABW1PDY6_9PSEU
MARRSGGARAGRLGALPLAFAITAAYVVVGGAAGVLALRAGTSASGPPVAAPASTTPRLPVITTPSAASPSSEAAPSSEPAPSSGPTASTTPAPPPGFRRVEAPGGLVTVVPSDWAVAPGTVPTTLVATDPGGRREARFGGAPVTDPGRTLLERITAAAAERGREPGHERLALAETSIRGFPAVRWEFAEPAGRTAVAYWETGGVEYVVYASGPPESWPDTQALLTAMVDAARP